MIDQWYDWWRLVLLFFSAAALYILGRKWFLNRKAWGEYQRDRWYGMSMWFLAAFEMQIEGILRDTELRFRLVFVTAACIVTYRLLTKKYDRDECGCFDHTVI
jgi:hypothetical protein